VASGGGETDPKNYGLRNCPERQLPRDWNEGDLLREGEKGVSRMGRGTPGRKNSRGDGGRLKGEPLGKAHHPFLGETA
jgi:hypothetical protein